MKETIITFDDRDESAGSDILNEINSPAFKRLSSIHNKTDSFILEEEIQDDKSFWINLNKFWKFEEENNLTSSVFLFGLSAFFILLVVIFEFMNINPFNLNSLASFFFILFLLLFIGNLLFLKIANHYAEIELPIFYIVSLIIYYITLYLILQISFKTEFFNHSDNHSKLLFICIILIGILLNFVLVIGIIKCHDLVMNIFSYISVFSVIELISIFVHRFEKFDWYFHIGVFLISMLTYLSIYIIFEYRLKIYSISYKWSNSIGMIADLWLDFFILPLIIYNKIK